MPKLNKGDQIEQFFTQKHQDGATIYQVIQKAQGKDHASQGHSLNIDQNCPFLNPVLRVNMS